MFVVAAALLFLPGCSAEDATPWDTISKDLLQHWSASLPPVPKVGLDVSSWQPSQSQGSFQVISSDLESAKFCAEEPGLGSGAWPASVQAGPPMWCEPESQETSARKLFRSIQCAVGSRPIEPSWQ